MSKNTEPNKYKISKSNLGNPLNSYKDFRAHKAADITEKEIDALCDDLVEWAKREDAETFLGFYKFYGLSRDTMDKRIARWPQLAEAKEIARDIIAERLQRKSFHKDYNCDFKAIQPVIRVYHHEYQEVWKEDQELKKENDPGKIIIQLEDFVKDKK